VRTHPATAVTNIIKRQSSEKKKFNNFLQEMKSLNVLRSGAVPGEYIFNVRMVRLYIWLQSLEEKNRQAGK